jgi:signal transduction histidine kinase
VRIVVTGEESDVRLEVVNVGTPIDPAVLAGIFEPLNRGEQRTSTDGSLGLGLYIAREIVKAHGGELAARSHDAETIFTARLPRFSIT